MLVRKTIPLESIVNFSGIHLVWLLLYSTLVTVLYEYAGWKVDCDSIRSGYSHRYRIMRFTLGFKTAKHTIDCGKQEKYGVPSSCSRTGKFGCGIGPEILNHQNQTTIDKNEADL